MVADKLASATIDSIAGLRHPLMVPRGADRQSLSLTVMRPVGDPAGGRTDDKETMAPPLASRILHDRMTLSAEQIDQIKANVPAGTTLNRGDMAHTLGVSGNTLDRWRKQMKGFPVKKGGQRGVRYEFDPHDVVEFLADQLPSEDAPSDNFFAAVGMDLAQDGPSGNQLKSLAAARDQVVRTLEHERALVQAERMEQVLRGIFRDLKDRCDALPEQLARRMNLNPRTRNALADEMEGFLRETAEGLRSNLNCDVTRKSRRASR